MQTGPVYTQDDFAQPGFCRACGTHVPKSFLAGTGGLCANCLATMQQMRGQQMGGMPYANLAPARPRTSFFRSTGFWALIAALVALGMLKWGASRYLRSPSLSAGKHRVLGVSDDIAKAPLSLVESPVDEATDADLKDMSTKVVAEAFGKDAVESIDTEAIRDKRTDSITYYASGKFACQIRKDTEQVFWKISYQRDDKGAWTLTNREAYFQTDDGVEQWDWDEKKFYRLVH